MTCFKRHSVLPLKGLSFEYNIVLGSISMGRCVNSNETPIIEVEACYSPTQTWGHCVVRCKAGEGQDTTMDT